MTLIHRSTDPARRTLLKTLSLVPALGVLNACATSSKEDAGEALDSLLVEASVADLHQGMRSGAFTAQQIVTAYVARIEQLDRAGPALSSVIMINPDAMAIARALDLERMSKGMRGPLHGIPILLKDNLDTDDEMPTTAGSRALLGSRPTQDAAVVTRLRAAGAIILGKANLSEWSNYRSNDPTDGWSARGGQTKNPYSLCATPFGSSSGSAVSVAANLTTLSIGTETNGSIIAPAAVSGVVGLKPTVGLTSRTGVIPISHNQDSVGPLARTVTDAALLLTAMTGPDPRDPATLEHLGLHGEEYSQFLDRKGLQGMRIGYVGGATPIPTEIQAVLAAEGATLVEINQADMGLFMTGPTDEGLVLSTDFKHDINRYLATRVRGTDRRYRHIPTMRTLDDLIAFNISDPAERLDLHDQDTFLEANARPPITDPSYLRQLDHNRRSSRATIDGLLARHNLNAFIGGMFTLFPSAMAGYPIITLPFHSADQGDMPDSITLSGAALSEPVLFKLAYALEQALKEKGLGRRPPRYLPC